MITNKCQDKYIVGNDMQVKCIYVTVSRILFIVIFDDVLHRHKS